MAKVSKKSYTHTVTLRNETEFVDVFETYKNDIYDHIMYVMESFDFDIDLSVIVRVLDDEKNMVNGETNDGATTIIKKKYTVILNVNSLKMIPRDGGLDTALTIWHELSHVYDLYHTMHNKYYKINPLSVNHKRFDDFVIAKGWGFWTEFYAYSITFKHFKGQHDHPTLLKLVKGYAKLQTQYEKINSLPDYKTDEANNALSSFIDGIKDFAYALSKHIAGEVEGKPYTYDYCEKTKSSEAFKTVEKLRQGFTKKLVPLFTNTYGKGMPNKMYELGKYLIKNLYIKFDLYPVKHHGHFRFAYYT